MPTNGSYPTAEQILAASQGSIAHEDVQVPEWGLTVPVCELTGSEIAEYRGFLTSSHQRIQQKRGQRGGDADVSFEVELHTERAQVKLCYLAMKDPTTGKRIFDKEADVGRLSSKGLARIFPIADRLSAATPEAEEQEGKDSSETPISDSPEPSPEATESRG